MPTTGNDGRELRISAVNRHPDQAVELKVNTGSFTGYTSAKVYSVAGKSKDSYNDVDMPDEVKIMENNLKAAAGSEFTVEINPHSVNVLELK